MKRCGARTEFEAPASRYGFINLLRFTMVRLLRPALGDEAEKLALQWVIQRLPLPHLVITKKMFGSTRVRRRPTVQSAINSVNAEIFGRKPSFAPTMTESRNVKPASFLSIPIIRSGLLSARAPGLLTTATVRLL